MKEISTPMGNRHTATFYDAILLAVDLTEQVLLFEANSHFLSVHSPHVSLWKPGAIGCLTLRNDDSFRFYIYPDQRLRRAEIFDDPNRSLWGWSLAGLVLLVHAGVVPGLNGQVVKRDVSTVTLDVPREFDTLCNQHSVTVAEVLRGFIADVCGLNNLCMLPREDGYCSNGSDERLHARQYWLRTHGWRAVLDTDELQYEPPYRPPRRASF